MCSSICSCVSLIFSTALYSHFCLENETHKLLEKMEIAKKNMILTVVSNSTIKFQNLVCKVSVSALYYLPIPIFTYTLV